MTTETQNIPADTSSDVLAERLRAALRLPHGAGGGNLAMTAALRGRHPADIAEAMGDLTRAEALAIFNWLDNARAAEVLDELDSDLVRYLLDNAPPGRIADLLDRLPMDDAAEVVAEATPEQAQELLADLSRRAPEDAAEVRELLSYGENTAGRLMTDQIVRLPAEMTVDQVFAKVRSADPEVETLSYLYVTDAPPTDRAGEGRLLGILSLRDLVRARPDQTVGEIMTPDPITVSVDTDQEEVARLIAKYDFLALPVIDRIGRLAGIVTVDDVVDVLEEEQTEDVLKLGAVGPVESAYLSTGLVASVRSRAGWLMLLFVASMFTGAVTTSFKGVLDRTAVLAVFMPLIVGTGGNAGAQAVMTVTRALALGEVQFDDWTRVLWREMRAGLALGGVLAGVGFMLVLFAAHLLHWNNPTRLALAVALSLVSVVIWANVVGALLPIAAKRLGFDPAVMSAPFITTLVDATGLFLYFTIARLLLGL